MNEENSRRKYNGWTNYETWVVRLWLDNEEPSYRYWTEQARRWHGRDDAAYRLAEHLEEELGEGSPVNGPTVYGDLMNAALAEVNWLEIAESYLEEVEPAESSLTRRLTLEELERLPYEEFQALPEDEKRRYFEGMDGESEFYGYEAEQEQPSEWNAGRTRTVTGGERVEGRPRLAVEEIGRLSRDDFRALPQGEKRRFFDAMDRENLPTPEEFYGLEAEREQPSRWPGDDEGPCDGRAGPDEAPDLRDDLRWRERCPGLPTVEVARRDEDPILWMRTCEPSYADGPDEASFYVAGYSGEALGGWLLSVGEILRGGATRFYGLMVRPRERTMQWMELDDDFLEYQGPGYISLVIDESWQPRRSSEVVRDYPGYTLLKGSSETSSPS